MNEFRTQPLRHFDVRLTTTGEVFTTPTKLYKGSYGFITLRCFVPITQNYVEGVTVPVVKVSRAITNAFGETVSDGNAYAMFFVEKVNIGGYDYSLHECLMPKPFTSIAGDLKMSFSYYEGIIGEDEKITHDNLLTSAIVKVEVEDGGIIADSLDVPEGDEWIAQINAVITNVNNIGKELDDANNKIEDLTVQRCTRVTENGEFVEEFDADKKADVEYVDKKADTKVSISNEASILYGTTWNGYQTTRTIAEEKNKVSNGRIAMYVDPTLNWGGEPNGALWTKTPQFDGQSANKKFVEDGLAGKLDATLSLDANPRAYVCYKDKQSTIAIAGDPSTATNGKIAQFYNNTITANVPNDVVLMTGAPTQDKHCANKQYVDDKFNGANKAVAFDSYSEMITTLLGVSPAEPPEYFFSQNIYIKTLNVPDLWISKDYLAGGGIRWNPYTYTSDEDFINELSTNGYVRVGWFDLSALETQEVDLTEYAKKEYVDDGLAGKLDKLNLTYSFVYAQTSAGKVNDKPLYYIDGSKENDRVNGGIPSYFGQNLYSGTPTKPYQAANKKYIDDKTSWTEVLIDVSNTTEWELPDVPDRTKVYMLTMQVGNVSYYGETVGRIDLVDGSLDGEEGIMVPNFAGCIDTPYFDSTFDNGGNPAYCLGEANYPWVLIERENGDNYSSYFSNALVVNTVGKLKLKITLDEGYNANDVSVTVRYKLEEVKYNG